MLDAELGAEVTIEASNSDKTYSNYSDKTENNDGNETNITGNIDKNGVNMAENNNKNGTNIAENKACKEDTASKEKEGNATSSEDNESLKRVQEKIWEKELSVPIAK